jgi:hypothetical protein
LLLLRRFRQSPCRTQNAQHSSIRYDGACASMLRCVHRRPIHQWPSGISSESCPALPELQAVSAFLLSTTDGVAAVHKQSVQHRLLLLLLISTATPPV